MLFIHGSLAMGGVETFILRMAKQRASENKRTVIILLSSEDRSDSGLVAEAKKYATVLFLPDLTYLPDALAKYFPFHLSLLLPLKSGLEQYLKDIQHVHVSCGICAFFYAHLARFLPANVKFTLGLYHSLEFCWGSGQLPYFERQNRELFFHKIDKRSILFFNEAMVPLYEKFSGQSFQAVNLFPLGVIEQLSMDTGSRQSLEKRPLKLVSVGRLVAFKTYNLHMLDVIAELKQRGIAVVYDIYGDGPLEPEMQSRISTLGLSEQVRLRGLLDYDLFSEVVSSYDIFVGSGTAIVQAAGLGVCAIIGIENSKSAETYGFLAELKGFSYNEDGLYDKTPIIDALQRYHNFNDAERMALSRQHMLKANEFAMDKCVHNFDSTPHIHLSPKMVLGRFSFMLRLRYSISLLSTSLKARLNKSSLSDQVRESFE